ncbi:hypothetical protein [Lysinibacillus sphaericus]|uniref:hypothetical protein n=1 Tax=Lysinibacillus sphaericus TaxID=1421 RepID=UPI001CC04527|nr:hypothetical protein [Lysinibacillus sphaericus]
MPKSDILYLVLKANQQLQIFSARKRSVGYNYSKNVVVYLLFLNFTAVEMIVQ